MQKTLIMQFLGLTLILWILFNLRKRYKAVKFKKILELEMAKIIQIFQAINLYRSNPVEIIVEKQDFKSLNNRMEAKIKNFKEQYKYLLN